MDFEFKIDAEIKQEFLESKPNRTARSNGFILKLADEYEEITNKAIYNMTYSELKELIAVQFKNSSVGSITKNVSILKKYIDFCIEKHLVSYMENRLTTFTRKNAKEFVSKQAIEYRYITREQLRKYQNMLANEQDVALLEAIYCGIRGRTQEGATLEELINLQIDINSNRFKENILELVRNNGRRRFIEISDKTKQILLNAYNQKFYISNNGEESVLMRGGVKYTVINHVGNYVFRVPGTKKHELFNPVLINSRMSKIQRWTGNEYLTIHSLYMSGMITTAKDIINQNGKITDDDYANICRQYMFVDKNNNERILNLKYIIQQYI